LTASQFSQRWDNRRRSLGGPHVRRRGLRARIGAQRLLLTPPPLVPLACVKLVPAVAFNLLFGQLERRRTYPSNEVLLDPTHVTRWIALPARRTGDRNGHGSPAVANATHDFVGAHANGRRVLRHAVRGEVPGRVVGWHPTPLCTLEADALTLFDRRRPVRATALRCGRLWMGRIEVAGRSCVGALAPPRRPLVRDTVPRGVTHDLPRLRDQLRRPSAVFFVVHRPLRCTRRLSGDADANRKSGSAPTCPATFGPEVILVPARQAARRSLALATRTAGRCAPLTGMLKTARCPRKVSLEQTAFALFLFLHRAPPCGLHRESCRASMANLRRLQAALAHCGAVPFRPRPRDLLGQVRCVAQGERRLRPGADLAQLHLGDEHPASQLRPFPVALGHHRGWETKALDRLYRMNASSKSAIRAAAVSPSRLSSTVIVSETRRCVVTWWTCSAR